MLLVVSKFKLIEMQLKVVHGQVQKANKNIQQEGLKGFITIQNCLLFDLVSYLFAFSNLRVLLSVCCGVF